jgi:hypothetical protein
MLRGRNRISRRHYNTIVVSGQYSSTVQLVTKMSDSLVILQLQPSYWVCFRFLGSRPRPRGRFTPCTQRTQEVETSPNDPPILFAWASTLFSLPEVWYTCAMRAPTRLRSVLAAAANVGNRHRLALWGLILVTLSLRLARLTFQPLWWDEGWSLYFATTDVGTLLELTAVDIHPPFYYLLLHLWIKLLGPASCRCGFCRS